MDHHPPPPPPPPLTGPAAAPPPGCGAVSCIRRPQRSDMAVLRRGGRRTGVCWPQPQARSRTATPARCTGVSRTRCHQVCRRCAAALHVAAAQRRGLPAALSSRRDAPATSAAAHRTRRARLPRLFGASRSARGAPGGRAAWLLGRRTLAEAAGSYHGAAVRRYVSRSLLVVRGWALRGWPQRTCLWAARLGQCTPLPRRPLPAVLRSAGSVGVLPMWACDVEGLLGATRPVGGQECASAQAL